MGGDWIDNLDEEELDVWNEFVNHFRKEALHKIVASDVFLSIVPTTGWDVKFAVELGAAIMEDKPIIAFAQPGAHVPKKLAQICEAVVVADLDTQEGRDAVLQQLNTVTRAIRNGTS